MSEFDSKALASAREVMALTKQEHIGGDAQLIAKIQLLFVDAMEYAAPQSFGNSEKLNSPGGPDGWKLMPKSLTLEMALAAAPYANGDVKEYYRALVASAPPAPVADDVVLHMGDAMDVFRALKVEMVSEHVRNPELGAMGAVNVQVWTSKIGAAFQYEVANGGCTLRITAAPKQESE